MRFFATTLLVLVMSVPVLAKDTPKEEAQYAIWDADFAELESCIQDVTGFSIALNCVGPIIENCKARSSDKSRSGAMGCFVYERDLWQLAYTRALGQAVGKFSKLEPRSYLLTKSRRNEAEVFLENEVLWRRASDAECEFYQHQNGSMAGGFKNQHCQMVKYANRIKYLNGLDSLGKR